jgi:hypothetical protein
MPVSKSWRITPAGLLILEEIALLPPELLQ